MRTDFYITGTKEMQERLNKIDRKVMAEMDNAINFIALDAEAKLKKKLSQSGTGLSYPRTKDGKVHVASAPGEPPAVDYGRLRSSVKSTILQKAPTGLITVSVGGAMVKYAKWLEFGTSRIKPRPFFQITIRNNLGWWVRVWRKHIRKGLD